MSETRIALALLKGLEAWQIANVAAFTASGIAQSAPVGAPYRDASGQEYQPMFVEPALVFAARPSRMRRRRRLQLKRLPSTIARGRAPFKRGTVQSI